MFMAEKRRGPKRAAPSALCGEPLDGVRLALETELPEASVVEKPRRDPNRPRPLLPLTSSEVAVVGIPRRQAHGKRRFDVEHPCVAQHALASGAQRPLAASARKNAPSANSARSRQGILCRMLHRMGYSWHPPSQAVRPGFDSRPPFWRKGGARVPPCALDDSAPRAEPGARGSRKRKSRALAEGAKMRES